MTDVAQAPEANAEIETFDNIPTEAGPNLIFSEDGNNPPAPANPKNSEGKDENGDPLIRGDEEVDSKKEEKKEEEKPKEEEKKQTGRPKGIRAKVGENDLNLDPKTMVSVKIDGEEKLVPIQELINKHSGQVAVEKRFSELNTQKRDLERSAKQWQSEKQQLVSMIQPVMEEYNKGNKINAVQNLVESFGFDWYDISNTWFTEQIPEFAKFMDMTEAEQRAYLLEKENGYLKQVSEKRLKSSESERSKLETERKLDAKRKSAGISEEDFSSHYDMLVENGFIKDDMGPEEQFDAVIEYNKFHVASANLEEAVNEAGVNLDEIISDKEEINRAIRFIVENEMTKAEIVEFFKEYSKELKSNKLVKDLDNRANENIKRNSAKDVREEKLGRPITFDDL